ncbi:hypothetical protein [Micavibrio aeruginosavorus]|uniref:hypothetical protein n=1 Tax=Micavibrio aeruginosavorus TaxID=349221 RepID=UPI003F4AD5EE
MKHLKKLTGCAGLALALAFSSAHAAPLESYLESQTEDVKQAVAKYKNCMGAKALEVKIAQDYGVNDNTYLENLDGEFDMAEAYSDPKTGVWVVIAQPNDSKGENMSVKIDGPSEYPMDSLACVIGKGTDFPRGLFRNPKFREMFNTYYDNYTAEELSSRKYQCVSLSQAESFAQKIYAAAAVNIPGKETQDFKTMMLYANETGTGTDGRKGWLVVGEPKNPAAMGYSVQPGDRLVCLVEYFKDGYPEDVTGAHWYNDYFDKKSGNIPAPSLSKMQPQ